MAIVQVKSTNPQFSFLIKKNPNSGVQIRSVRQGIAYEGTARNYISNLYGKLDVVDRAQAIIRLMPLISSPLKSPRLRSK